MNNRTSDFLHLAIQAILLLPAVVFFEGIIHELGHGLGAILVGAQFHGFYVSFVGGGGTLCSGFTEPWREVFSALMGSGVGLLLGLFVFIFVLPRLKRWDFQIFWSYFCFIALIDMPLYMFTTSILSKAGDFGKMAAMLHIPTVIFGIMGAAGVAYLIFIFSRVFAGLLSRHFSVVSYFQRFSVFALMFLLPAIFFGIILAAAPFHRMTGLRGLITAVVLALVVSALMALRRATASDTPIPVPKSASLSAFGIFTLGLLVWQGVFGNVPNLRGLVWSAPPEPAVSCWNLRLSIGPDFVVHADFLMRATVVDMIWDKQKLTQPLWQPYDSLARANSASLMPSIPLSLLDRKQDDSTDFSLFGFDRRGARRISYAGMLPMDSAKQVSADRVLKLDFHSILDQKLFCLLDIQVDSTLTMQSCDLVPAESGKPILQKQNRLQFASMTLEAVKLIRIRISRK